MWTNSDGAFPCPPRSAPVSPIQHADDDVGQDCAREESRCRTLADQVTIFAAAEFPASPETPTRVAVLIARLGLSGS